DQPPELVAHSLDPGALAEELGHRAHRAPHVTPTGQLGVQTLTTRTPLTTALSGRNSLIPCEFPLGTGFAYCYWPWYTQRRTESTARRRRWSVRGVVAQ